MAEPNNPTAGTLGTTEANTQQRQMPQLDATTFVPQLFWLAVTFVVLYVLMKRLALPRVGAAIAARRARLDGDLAQANALRTQAESVLADYERALASARAAAQTTMRETGERLASEAAERQRQMAASLAEQIEAAERRIAQTKDQAVAEVRGIAVEVAQAVAEKLTGAAPERARVSAAVDRVLAERTA